ncbi:phosphatidylinositol 4-phosphate 5-kinase [Acrasis kona]|uniref:Phosphatidylinositol 4-phosphate 5-kinase n=1 Tax=Acrasis kona TaxID=1008807 RepID=A0AAW2ZSZ2_9EUKA
MNRLIAFVPPKRHLIRNFMVAFNRYESSEDHFTGRAYKKFENGDVYEGDFVDGKFHGKGVLRYHDGGVYDGSFENFERQGRGTYTSPDGGRYEGEFNNSVPSGYGTLNYPDGTVYEGQIQDGIKKGVGKIRYPDGSVYEGEFDKDLEEGQGRLVKKTGEVCTGPFVRGKLNGLCTMCFNNENGSFKFVGTFVDNQRHGESTLYHESGATRVCTYVNDRIVGKVVSTLPNGQVSIENVEE